MEIIIESFKINVDFDATLNYRDIYNEQCNCVYCRNYYKALSSNYPQLIKFLEQFGINIMHPIEIVDLLFNVKENKRQYCAYYSIKGELPVDKIQTKVNDVSLVFRNWNIADESYSNTGMEKPYVIVELYNISLPWVLGEPMED